MHEFNIKNGFITSGQSYVYNNLVVTGLTISSVPTNDDTLTQILARDSSGNVKYRTASSLGGGSSTFTGGTVSGATNFTGGLSANTISATTITGTSMTVNGSSSLIGGSRAAIYIRNSRNSGNQSSMLQFGSVGTPQTWSLLTDLNADGTTINQLDFYNTPLGNSSMILLSDGGVKFNYGITANTISASTYQGNLVTSIVAGSNISVNQATGNVTVDAVPSGSQYQIQISDGSNFLANSALFYDYDNNTSNIGSTSATLGASATKSALIAGEFHTIDSNQSNNVIVGGNNNRIGQQVSDSVIIGGNGNAGAIEISDQTKASSVIGGYLHQIYGNSENSVIIGGYSNEINSLVNTVIIGGNTISAGESNFVYVPSLNINTTPVNDDTLTEVLVRDSGNGNVKYRNASSLGGGGTTFTGGTVSGATNFINGLTANTISATTYQNLPISGLTQGSNVTITNNGQGNYTISSTGGGGSFTGGTVNGPTIFTSGVTANTIVYSIVTLTYASTISVNAVLGNEFKVTLTGSAVLGNPSGAVDGQYLRFAIRQDGTGGRNLTFDTKYRFGNEIGTPSVDLTANKTSYLGIRYNADDDKFDVISFVSGY
jgi:hypothetical protein